MRRAPFFVLVSALALGTACEDLVLSDYMPTVTFSELSLNEVDFNTLSADFKFKVNNPNPIDVNLARFDYELGFEGIEWLAGDSPDGLTIGAAGSSEIALPVEIEFESLYEMVQAVRGEDEIGFSLDGSFGFDTSIGPIDIPYAEEGGFPALRTPGFGIKNVSLDGYDFSSVDLGLNLNVDNDHASTLDFLDVDYEIHIAGSKLATGFVDSLGAVDGAETATLTLPFEIGYSDALSAGLDLVNGGELEAKLVTGMEVDTPFGLVPLTISVEDRTVSFD